MIEIGFLSNGEANIVWVYRHFKGYFPQKLSPLNITMGNWFYTIVKENATDNYTHCYFIILSFETVINTFL